MPLKESDINVIAVFFLFLAILANVNLFKVTSSYPSLLFLPSFSPLYLIASTGDTFDAIFIGFINDKNTVK